MDAVRYDWQTRRGPMIGGQVVTICRNRCNTLAVWWRHPRRRLKTGRHCWNCRRFPLTLDAVDRWTLGRRKRADLAHTQHRGVSLFLIRRPRIVLAVGGDNDHRRRPQRAVHSFRVFLFYFSYSASLSLPLFSFLFSLFVCLSKSCGALVILLDPTHERNRLHCPNIETIEKLLTSGTDGADMEKTREDAQNHSTTQVPPPDAARLTSARVFFLVHSLESLKKEHRDEEQHRPPL